MKPHKCNSSNSLAFSFLHIVEPRNQSEIQGMETHMNQVQGKGLLKFLHIALMSSHAQYLPIPTEQYCIYLKAHLNYSLLEKKTKPKSQPLKRSVDLQKNDFKASST